MAGLIAQPMILRECKSITAAKYNQPVRVRMVVMPVLSEVEGSDVHA